MNKKAKVMMLLGCILVFALVMGGCASSGDVGILDRNKVMNENPKVKEYNDQLSQKAQDLTKQLEAQKAGLTPEQYQAKYDAATKDFLQFRQGLETQMEDSLKQATEQVAKEKKLKMVVYKEAVGYGGTDVTQDVINKMK